MTHRPRLELESPQQYPALRDTILRKPALRRFYELVYENFAACRRSCPRDGICVELGSGAGFLKSRLAEVITSDIIPYPHLDVVFDGAAMPFRDASVALILLLNTFHHINRPESFLNEVDRCLKPGGRMYIVDQNLGWISTPILRFLHHEGFDPDSLRWEFDSSGPLAGANGALAWIVFRRDEKRFRLLYPELRILKYRPHTPMLYWISGGLTRPSLAPGWATNVLVGIDKLLMRISPRFGSFVDIEILRERSRQ